MYKVKRKTCEASLASGIVELFEDDECSMTDVTLACEGQFIQAHKLVLAASSPFFKRFIKINRADKGGTVLIALANVKYSELEAIVHLIYYGEILVGKDDYEGFLKAVKLLELESIIDLKDREDELDLHVPNTSQKLAGSTGGIFVANSGAVFHHDDVTEGTHQHQKMETGLIDENEIESGLFQYDGDYHFKLDNSEEGEIDVEHSESFTVDPISTGQSGSGVERPERRKVRPRRSKIKESVHGFGGTIAKMVGSKSVSVYQCLCGSSFKSKGNCGRHIQDKNSQAKYTCTICGSKLNSQRYLQDHRKRYHQSVP